MLTSRQRGIVFVLALAMVAAVAPMRAASAACVPIRTVADLNKIRKDLSGSFCLMNDLDFTGVGAYPVIGGAGPAFTGKFDGGGHVIRHLAFRSAAARVGLFGWIDGGQVMNLTLAGVAIESTRNNASVGAVAGLLGGAAVVNNVHVTGALNCANNCHIGGIAGDMETQARVVLSSSLAAVTGGNGGAAGGVTGQSSGTILRSFSGGPVACGTNCAAGGLAGFLTDLAEISFSFATGAVRGAGDGSAGGLVGTGYGLIRNAFSTGPVAVDGDSLIASLIGYHGGKLRFDYAVGRVRANAGSSTGGLIAILATAQASTLQSYWDLGITRQGNSAQGQGRTTAALQAALPAGFDAPWAITKGYSYPYLADPDIPFASPLATAVKAGKVYTFLPIQQREPTEYLRAPRFADLASLAAVYAMIARTIGVTDNYVPLQTARIDQNFWDDATQTATWGGGVTQFATLSGFVGLPAGIVIGDGNVIGHLKTRKVVIVRGSYDKPRGGTGVHWMLATLFASNNAGATTSLIANDPWTGKQVWINPTTKRVTRPANFPLTNFRVDGYRAVTLN